MVYGNHPFTAGEKKEPIFIGESALEHVLYPLDNLDFSDVCAMYLSTDDMTVCVMEIGPGGMFTLPDIHPGDETYLVLDGSITLMNPVSGQCVEVARGQAALIPKGTLHTGYNFGREAVRVLAAIAPRAKEEPAGKTDVNVPKRLLRHDGAREPSQAFVPRLRLGTVDDMGAWPEDALLLRREQVIYPVREEDKLRVVHGDARPMLVKFSVSNDVVHVGEYTLQVGGQTAAQSERLAHGGQAFLYGLCGRMTVVVGGDRRVFHLAENDGLYIPPGMEYQLANYTGHVTSVAFVVSNAF